MSHFERRLQLADLLHHKSHFLFGPRSTGKSFLIREQLGDRAILLNLLRSDLYLRLSANPSELEAMIELQISHFPPHWVVIDEVQRIPELLNEVHRLIEEKGWVFLLTGSSARSLKRGQSNLLAGRARNASFFPLVSCEFPVFDLDRYLWIGGLPFIQNSDDPQDDLDAYVTTYLREEIQAEGRVRHLDAFSRFLTHAAAKNAEIVNFTKLASDAQVPPSTVREYFSILEDTLIGFMLPPWNKSQKRKAVSTSKFYFFDVGVTHQLAGHASLDRHSDLYGQSFEQWMAIELRAAIAYSRTRNHLSYWRSVTKHEVDFIVGDDIAIETKASASVSMRDAKGLLALQEEGLIKRFYLVSQDPIEKLDRGIQFVHWKTFVKKLWSEGI